MPRPIALKSGVYHLNVRVPVDLASKVKGSIVTLPLGTQSVRIRASDKVIMSLRTKDAALAKARFAEALGSLRCHWDAVRAGPKSLTQRQIVALAGDVYRSRLDMLDGCEQDAAAFVAEQVQAFDRNFGHLCDGDEDDPTGLSVEYALNIAELREEDGPELCASHFGRDVEGPNGIVTHDEAITTLYGDEVDQLIGERQLIIDADSRRHLIREVAEAVRLAGDSFGRQMGGDYSPDRHISRFPDFVPSDGAAIITKPSLGRTAETALELFERWSAYHADKRSASTIRRYKSSLASLDAWAKGRDWRALSDQDIFDWATQRVEKDGVAAETVNKNDLVAVSSVLRWPTTVKGGKRSIGNPAAGVKLDLPNSDEDRAAEKREKAFRPGEIKTILHLARSVTSDPRFPRASASRRWCPWLCAYSGARVQETLWLKKEDVRHEDGVWIMHLRRTKTKTPRKVPIHDALIDEGFLAFVKTAPSGYLFIGDREPKAGGSRTAQELRAAELAAWIKSKANLDGVSPNHGWRHTWSTLAVAAGIDKLLRNRITGHNFREDISDGYVHGLIPLLAAEMRKFPRYKL